MDSLAERHAIRLQAACASMSLPSPLPKIRVRIHADGRRSFPNVIQYRLHDGRLLDLPPLEQDVPYWRVVHDNAACDLLAGMNALDAGHQFALTATPAVIDNRPTSGA